MYMLCNVYNYNKHTEIVYIYISKKYIFVSIREGQIVSIQQQEAALQEYLPASEDVSMHGTKDLETYNKIIFRRAPLTYYGIHS